MRMRKGVAVAVALALCVGLGGNAAAEDSVISAGFNMSASGWNSISGPSPGNGELRFSSPMSTFVQNATGSLSLGSTPMVNGVTSVGPGGGSASAGFSLLVSASGMAGVIAPVSTPYGEYPGWQGANVNVFKQVELFTSSSGDASSFMGGSVGTWGSGTFVPPVPVMTFPFPPPSPPNPVLPGNGGKG